MNEIPTSEVVFRDDLYPRFKPDGALIQRYASNVDVLPPIELSQHKILIDGYHRLKAHETAGSETIPYFTTKVASERELEMLAVTRNAKHGHQLTDKEKRHYAVQWWGVLPSDEICEALSITDRTFRSWTEDKRKQRDEELSDQIYSMWMACCTQSEISDCLDIPRRTVGDKIAEFGENGNDSESATFSNFSPQLYSVWNFAKATNDVKIFGSIPPEIIDNLLYYYTDPLDVVFDPFGGGGSTIDKCLERNRRYFVSDLNPIPARETDIRQHDITTGLPDGLPVPRLVFLDPPYWKQAEKKYSKAKTDLGNVDLDEFLNVIGNIARSVKRKWAKKLGVLALIIGPWKNDGAYVDLPFLCYEKIKKYLKPVHRIAVPYSTEVHGGAYVSKAKENKEILYLHRDLMIFGE